MSKSREAERIEVALDNRDVSQRQNVGERRRGTGNTQGASTDVNFKSAHAETRRDRIQGRVPREPWKWTQDTQEGRPLGWEARGGRQGSHRMTRPHGPGSGSTESWPLSGDWAGRQGGPRGSLGVSEPCRMLGPCPWRQRGGSSLPSAQLGDPAVPETAVARAGGDSEGGGVVLGEGLSSQSRSQRGWYVKTPGAAWGRGGSRERWREPSVGDAPCRWPSSPQLHHSALLRLLPPPPRPQS